ncbi:MAG: hypothetical protein KA791_13500, partial [Flavobacteriales bacterium]|nr:hypothetical protein [Flavobacteriales bacterium]
LHGPFILLSYFLWFLPYQQVRFAAETWSGLLFLLGLSVLLGSSVRNRSWLIAGVCFGVCAQMKPSMIVACGGAVCWALLNSETQGRSLARLVSGGVIALALGAVVDSWFYNEPIHTLWNYLYKNSLSISKVHPLPVASETYPWWYYFPWIIKYGIWPIGALLLGSLLWLTYRAPRSLMVWCIWPYLVLVSAIPHKELRFLFPLVDLAPLVLVLAWQEFEKTTSRFAAHSAIVRGALNLTLVALLMVNAGGLITAGLTAAGSGRVRLAERMIAIHPSDPMTVGYILNEPMIWDIRVPEFYLWGDFVDVGTFDPCASPSVLSDPKTPALLIAPEDEGSSAGCTLDSISYYPFARSEAAWATFMLDLYNSERHGPYVLYANDRSPSPPSEP